MKLGSGHVCRVDLSQAFPLAERQSIAHRQGRAYQSSCACNSISITANVWSVTNSVTQAGIEENICNSTTHNRGTTGEGMHNIVMQLAPLWLMGSFPDSRTDFLTQEEPMAGPPTIVVFGGNGFVGSSVCEEAVRTGLGVVSVNRSGPPKTGADWISKVEWVRVRHACALAQQVQPATAYRTCQCG